MQVDALRAIAQLAAISDATVLMHVARTVEILDEEDVMSSPPLGQPPSSELHIFVKVVCILATKADPAIRDAITTIFCKRAENPGAIIGLFLAPFANLVGSLTTDNAPSTALAAQAAAHVLVRVANTGLLDSLPRTQTIVTIVKMVTHLVRLSRLCPTVGGLFSSADNSAGALLEMCARTLSITRRMQRLARRRLAATVSSSSTAVADEPRLERWIRAYANTEDAPCTHSSRRYFIFGDAEASVHRPCYVLPLCNADLPLSRQQLEAMATAGAFDVGVYALLQEDSGSFLDISEFLADTGEDDKRGLQGNRAPTHSLDSDAPSQSMQHMLEALRHELEQAHASHGAPEAEVRTVHLDDWYQDDISEVTSQEEPEPEPEPEPDRAVEAVLEFPEQKTSNVAFTMPDLQGVATDARYDCDSGIRPELAALVSGQEMLAAMIRRFEERSEQDRRNYEQEMHRRMSRMESEIKRQIYAQQDQEARIAKILAENQHLMSHVAELKEQSIRVQQEADESNRRLQEHRNSAPNELAMYQGFSRKLERIEHTVSNLHATIEQFLERSPELPPTSASCAADTASKEQDAVDQLRQLIETLRDEQAAARHEHQQLLQQIRAEVLIPPFRKAAESTPEPAAAATIRMSQATSAEQVANNSRHDLNATGARSGSAPDIDSFGFSARYNTSAHIGPKIPASRFEPISHTPDFLKNFQRIKHDWQRMKGPLGEAGGSPPTSPLRESSLGKFGVDVSADAHFRPSAALSILESMRSCDVGLEGCGTSSFQLLRNPSPQLTQTTASRLNRDHLLEPLREYKGRLNRLGSPSFFQF